MTSRPRRQQSLNFKIEQYLHYSQMYKCI